MLKQIITAACLEPRLVAALAFAIIVFTGIWIETP